MGFGMGKVEVFFVLATSKSKSRGGGLVTFLSVYICTAKRTSSTSIFFFLAWFENTLASSVKKKIYIVKIATYCLTTRLPNGFQMTA